MYWPLYLSLCLVVSGIQAEFPSGKLKEILLENTVDVEPKDLVGTWTTVYEAMYITASCPSSYNVFELQEDNTLKVVSYCYDAESLRDDSKKKGDIDFIKKKLEGEKKGIFTTFQKEAGEFHLQHIYVFYQDEHVQGYYACSPDEKNISILKGWDVNISVKADRKAQFLAKTGANLNEVQLSVFKAIQKLLQIKLEQDIYVQQSGDEVVFGLIGPTYFLDLSILRP